MVVFLAYFLSVLYTTLRGVNMDIKSAIDEEIKRLKKLRDAMKPRFDIDYCHWIDVQLVVLRSWYQRIDQEKTPLNQRKQP